MYRKRLQKQQLLLLQQLLVMLVLGWQLHGVAGIDPADPATSTADSQQQLQHLGTHNGQPPASCLTAAAIVAGCCKDAPPGRPSASRANSILLSYFIGATNDIYGGYRSALRSSTALAVSKWFSGLRRCTWCSCRVPLRAATSGHVQLCSQSPQPLIPALLPQPPRCPCCPTSPLVASRVA